jgi:hypothetical protein
MRQLGWHGPKALRVNRKLNKGYWRTEEEAEAIWKKYQEELDE